MLITAGRTEIVAACTLLAVSELSWQGQIVGDERHVQFSLAVEGEEVPGVAFMPASDPDEPMPLVLIQHPATSSKDDYFVRDVGIMWARRGWVCAGIDAPLHGDRTAYDPLSLFREPGRFAAATEQFAAEVTAVIDALAAEFPVNLSRLGYVGYSMGSMLGVPAVARDGRFKAAAFCLVGESSIRGAENGLAYARRLGPVAVRVVGKLQDELIPRESTEALYAALPGVKDIVWLPGGHYQIGPDVIQAAGDWLKAKL